MMGFKLKDVLSDANRRTMQDGAEMWNTCPSGKRAYETKVEADKRLAFLHDTTTVMGMKAYRCGYCMKFHLGHRRGAR